MSETSGEKQFDATPSRIAKAKREGNIARSQEFAANFAFAAAVLSTFAIAPVIGAFANPAITEAAHGKPPIASAYVVGCALVPIAAAALAACAGSILQNGGLQFVPVTLKFERMQPLEGMKRLLSRETVLHAVRAAIAFSMAAAAIVPAMHDLFGIAASNDTPVHVAAVAWAGAQRVIVAAAAVGGIFAFAEYGVARRAWLRKLKMSFDELKRDMKEHDGDPTTRSRRKAFHRTLVRGSLMKVKEASFVIVNPTHVAVALRYQPPEVAVPVVLVRAAGETALRVRDLAREHHIPVVENVALARALLRDATDSAPIPHAHYVAVAEIVAALIRSGVMK